MKEEKVIFACLEHAELALDDYVNFEEIAPQIIKIQDENQKCNYCEKNAEYKVMA
ncbi:MAG: CxxH/CxxC protein [Sedimentibacter sp.]